MTFEEWFHKEYEPSDLQIKQYAERKEGLHIPAELYLEDIQKAYEAGQKDSETQIEKMKCCENCKHSDTECEGYAICGIGHYDDCLSNKIFDHTTDEKDYWEIKENE